MINAYKKLWINGFKFEGRSTRSDYWYVVLVNLIVSIVIGILSGIVAQLSILTYVYFVATLVPSIALIVRRLHDINKSGWSYLWILVPIVGFIMMLVFLCTPSVNENNQYGEIL